MNITKHLEILGMEVEDRVTRFKGVVSTVSFDLYGCIQTVVCPGIDKNGQLQESKWFVGQKNLRNSSCPSGIGLVYNWRQELFWISFEYSKDKLF